MSLLFVHASKEEPGSASSDLACAAVHQQLMHELWGFAAGPRALQLERLKLFAVTLSPQCPGRQLRPSRQKQ